MGLDMYLNTASKELARKAYQWHLDNDYWTEAQKYYMTEGVIGYWRKANAIHDWFVKNVQDGEDDCARHLLYFEDIAILKAICKQVLDDHSLAPKLLPTAEGFFFGSTEYDDWYFHEIKYTFDLCCFLYNNLVTVQKPYLMAFKDDVKDVDNYDYWDARIEYESSW